MADQPARPLIAAVEPDGVPLPQRYWAILTIALLVDDGDIEQAIVMAKSEAREGSPGCAVPATRVTRAPAARVDRTGNPGCSTQDQPRSSSIASP